ncbi:Transglycosylase SLT domain-containing protein [Palleronia marisminoris]|uniref:Soluble lytic murein transglycosylase n=1 Tax=Palleronia marisminoris TaxID=315423 RepID=A0A1Y5RAP3_9RHOB|nr:lytic transglycosylase domain-containing protein [Palleronia marisminoris]SFG05812.1 Transglycosylase SLT domain-containing protein [Palleronia marisminoris]SLN10497.1 Soluble lytic murein transglycosylase precursor [Palleronia marisminoris]
MIRQIAILGLLLAPGMATADTLFASKGASDFSAKLGVIDRRAASQYEGSKRLQPVIKAGPERVTPSVVPARVSSYRGTYLNVARQAAQRHGIPEAIFLNLVQRESAWNPGAISHKGAIGLAQLMPGTAQQMGVDPLDPAQNLEGGARYLATQYRRFQDWRLALAAYNAGPGAVIEYGGIPPYAETTAYVIAILGQ